MAATRPPVLLGLLRATVALSAVLAPLALAPAALAQDVTGTIRGQVTDDSGAPIAGATVTIVHVPTGTRSVVTSDASGSFSAANLRIGGPFQVTVAAPGFDSATATITNVVSGEPQRLAVFLVPEGQTIEVTAARARESSISLQTGAAFVLSADDIRDVATVNRDVRTLAARSPYVVLDPTNGTGAISIAGQNNRFNRITVDGIAFGDPFGLEAGGLASARGPVPLDAIGEFTVQVAPVDIQQGNFQGGAVDTVLKSGTNRLGFTGFWSLNDDSLSGKNTRGTKVNRDFTSRIWGVQLTGPIIKDKLFFAVTYEQLDNSTPALVGPAGEGFGNTLNSVTRANITRIQQIARGSRYNYDPLDVPTNVEEDDKKLVAKLDWNITDDHRLAATYIYNEGNLLAGQTGLAQVGAVNETLSLQSNAYNQGSINHYGVLQLNSDWTEAFSTQVRFSYNDYTRLQVPYNGREFGQFQVCLAPGPTTGTPTPPCPAGTGRIQFGPDISRQANELDVKTWGIEFLARLRQNNHDVKAILERRTQSFNNLFAQNVSGNWRFDSIADFEAGRANNLFIATPVRGDIDTVRAIFTNVQWTFGGQDSWDVRPDLTFVYGFRYDLYESGDRPLFNQAFADRYGFANNATLNGRGILQPRFGINWRADDRLTLRGSAGLFAGGSPNVWISNSFSNPGPLLASTLVIRNANGTFSIPGIPGLTPAQVAALGSATLDNVRGGQFIPAELLTLLRAQGPALATTNALDPDFRLPSQWRISGTVDYRLNAGPLGDDWRLGGDIIYSRVRDALTWTDLRSVRNTVQPTLPDGRPRYQPFSPTSGNNQDVFLTNTDKGYSWNIIARLDKRWESGLDFGFAYTFQRAKDENPGTSSVALSNYNNAASADPNNAAYGTSIYQRDNAFRVNLGYQREFFRNAATRIDLFFNSVAGQRYSHTFQDPTPNRSAVFGTTGTNNRYLLYVPNVSAIDADPRVTYNNAATFEAFRNFVLNSELADYQGQIVPKNLGQSPRFNKLDISVAQQIPFFRGSRIEAFADFENFLNMIDSDLGSLRQVAFPYYATIVNVACQGTTSLTAPCTRYVYSNFRDPVLTNFVNISTWAVRLGVRFTY
ncbi:carboxypeptidase regulatory-like domain-containing protein [Thermaurantiacus tibetensis]|uniref:TonB-dependent receptor n=1 Tax=Thermaurantiacus tibetensis TaxID=2759035 RepID=UPI001890096C|nr:carboxypeptidase regulatory-like domain-containing protein [Thermaurantiacus tibetensis]